MYKEFEKVIGKTIEEMSKTRINMSWAVLRKLALCALTKELWSMFFMSIAVLTQMIDVSSSLPWVL